MSRNLYGKKTSRNTLYGSTTQSEPNLRVEMNNTIDGNFPEIAKGQTLVIRSMRRDSNNKLIKCPCVDILTGEPDKDTFCPICFSEGYLWDEVWAKGYTRIIRSSVDLAGSKEELIGPGTTNIHLASFFLKAEVDVTQEDKIVIISLNKDGSVVEPHKREKIYSIITLIDFRSDNGKLEYYKIDGHEEQYKFLNGLER